MNCRCPLRLSSPLLRPRPAHSRPVGQQRPPPAPSPPENGTTMPPTIAWPPTTFRPRGFFSFPDQFGPDPRCNRPRVFFFFFSSAAPVGRCFHSFFLGLIFFPPASRLWLYSPRRWGASKAGLFPRPAAAEKKKQSAPDLGQSAPLSNPLGLSRISLGAAPRGSCRPNGLPESRSPGPLRRDGAAPPNFCPPGAQETVARESHAAFFTTKTKQAMARWARRHPTTQGLFSPKSLVARKAGPQRFAPPPAPTRLRKGGRGPPTQAPYPRLPVSRTEGDSLFCRLPKTPSPGDPDPRPPRKKTYRGRGPTAPPQGPASLTEMPVFRQVPTPDIKKRKRDWGRGPQTKPSSLLQNNA